MQVRRRSLSLVGMVSCRALLRHVDLEIGDVGWQLHVHRELALPAGHDQAVDLVGGILGGELGLRRGHLGERAIEVASPPVGERVVHQIAMLDGPHGRRATDAYDRHMLAIGTSDAVDRAECADAVGDHQGTQPMEPCVAIGGIGGVQLITGADPGWIAALRYLLHELQIVVTRNAEEVLDARLVQPPEHEITDGLFHGRIFLFSRSQSRGQSGLHSLLSMY